MLFPIINRFTITKKQIPFLLSSLGTKNINSILDYTNEKKHNHRKNYLEIMNLIHHYPNQYIAVKLSSLDVYSKFRVETYLQNIVEHSIQKKSKILVDAENSILHDKINSTVDAFMEQYNKKNVNIYKTFQMYRKDSFSMLKENLIKERDYNIGVKLVRGAYYKEDCIHDILFKTIEETHENYNNGIIYFSKNSLRKDVLMCATHNETSISIAKKVIDKEQLEFAHLLGMSDKMSLQLAKENYKMFKYVPYGNFHDTVPYLLRRLYENYPMLMNLWK